MFNSLDRHLSRPEQHDGLPFHAECPVCRQRLAGTLPREGPVTRQAQAALAAGVLAVSAASPAAAVAQSSGDAAATAQQSPVPPPPADPTLDPGWEAPGPEGVSGEEAPEQAPPAIDDGLGGGEEETGPVEIEPPADTIPDQPTLEAAPAPPAPPVEQPPPPEPAPAPAPAPPPPVEQPPAPAPEVEQPPAGQPAAEAKPHRQAKKRAGEVRQRVRELARKITAAPESVAPQSTVQPPPTTITTAVTPAVAQAPVDPQPVAISRAAIKGDTYTVRPGDSLWSIARRELGSTASTGQLAGEVHRLWTLNADRIATGDPNLLRVGTVLTLR